MSHRILFLASLPFVATSFVSLLATPASSASLQTQQKQSSELLPDNNSNDSTLVAGLFDIDIDLNNRHHDRWRDRDDYRWRRDHDDRWWRSDRDDRWRDRDDRWRDRDDYRWHRDWDHNR
ncbi:MAG: hypothetical protein JOZ78_25865 [Chroococcidiopsidaceae cyanobacterium CP_BM_ER_R8_30]|nr:hypothetical protein [Chroococcidiopsidaceae cyanobacterium CP_BM_ER_R8_30]